MKTKDMVTESSAQKEQSKLKMVAAVRHVDDELYDDATIFEQKAEEMGIALRKIIPKNLKVVVYCSPVKRAQDTASGIAKALGAEVIIVRDLCHDYYSERGLTTDALLRHCDGSVDAAVVVTHHEMPSGIVDILLSRKFGKNFESRTCKKGDGYFIDLQTGELKTSLFS